MARAMHVEHSTRLFRAPVVVVGVATLVAMVWYLSSGAGGQKTASVVVVSGRPVASGVVPTRTEPSSSSPVIFHPQQTGQPAAVASGQSLGLYTINVGPDESSSTAAIGASRASARTYVTGAILEDGSVVEAISADHVVINRDGQSYTLYTAGADVGARDQAAASTLQVGAGPAVQRLPRPASRVEEVLRFTPAPNGDGTVGLALHPGTQGRHFEQWGLKSGDVLLSLGDQQGADASDMGAQLAQLAEGRSLVARIRRGSEEVQVVLDGSGIRKGE